MADAPWSWEFKAPKPSLSRQPTPSDRSSFSTPQRTKEDNISFRNSVPASPQFDGPAPTSTTAVSSTKRDSERGTSIYSTFNSQPDISPALALRNILTPNAQKQRPPKDKNDEEDGDLPPREFLHVIYFFLPTVLQEFPFVY
mgnify:FL=1